MNFFVRILFTAAIIVIIRPVLAGDILDPGIEFCRINPTACGFNDVLTEEDKQACRDNNALCEITFTDKLTDADKQACRDNNALCEITFTDTLTETDKKACRDNNTLCEITFTDTLTQDDKDACKTNPSNCGITFTDELTQNDKDACKTNPSDCGITFTDELTQKDKDECKANPSDCGITFTDELTQKDKDECKTNPSDCGITFTDELTQKDKDECKANPSNCGITFTDTLTEADKKVCKDNPSLCGIDTIAIYDGNILNIPIVNDSEGKEISSNLKFNRVEDRITIEDFKKSLLQLALIDFQGIDTDYYPTTRDTIESNYSSCDGVNENLALCYDNENNVEKLHVQNFEFIDSDITYICNADLTKVENRTENNNTFFQFIVNVSEIMENKDTMCNLKSNTTTSDGSGNEQSDSNVVQKNYDEGCLTTEATQKCKEEKKTQLLCNTDNQIEPFKEQVKQLNLCVTTQ
ncbi:MAG: hypothetical protein QM487_04355 [Candidatus Marithrix sp.]